MKDLKDGSIEVVKTLIHNELVKCAVQRKVMTTAELSMCLGLRKDRTTTNVLVECISKICKDCFDKQMPLLTTLIVKRNKGDQPTNAWCLFYAEHVLKVEDPSSFVKHNQSDLKKYFDAELEKIYYSYPYQ